MHLSFLSTEVIHTYSYLECNNQIPQIHRDTRPVEWGDEPYSGLDVYMFFLDTDTDMFLSKDGGHSVQKNGSLLLFDTILHSSQWRRRIPHY